MIIDFSTHLVPKSVTKLGVRFPPFTGLWDIDLRLRVMRKYKIDMQVATVTTPVLVGATGKREVYLCRKINDALSKVQEKYDGRFIVLASVPLDQPGEAIDELERAHNDLGIRGVQLLSNANGKGLDSKEFFGFYDRMVKLDMPIFLHPTDFAEPGYSLLNDYGLKIRLSWPFDTAQAMSRLVFGGVVDKFPKLRIITHHIGSVIPIFIGRLQSDPKDRHAQSRSAHPSDTLLRKFKSFYADTAVSSWGLQLRTGLEFFGAKHVVFGSDYPYGYNDGEGYLRDNLRLVNKLKIPSAAKELILEENTRKLLKL